MGKAQAGAPCNCSLFVHKQPNCVLSESETNLELNGVQVPCGTYPAVQ